MPIAQIGSNLDLFHIDSAMTDFAVGYAQDAADFIGDQVAPVVSVGKRSDAYWKGRTEHMQRHNTLRQNRSQFGRGSQEFQTDTYYCKQFGWEQALDWADPQNEDEALDLENEQVTLCVDILQLDYECRVAAVAQDTSVFTHHTGVSATLLDPACDPVPDVEDAKDEVRGKIGHVPNTVTLGYKAWRRMLLLDSMKERIKYTGDQQASVITPAQVCQVLGVDRLLIGKAVYDSTPALPGQDADPTMIDVWDPNIIIVSYVDPRIAPMRGKVISPMRTFVWNKFGGRFATRTYQQDETTSTVVQSLDFTDEKPVVPNAAYILTGAMAAYNPSSSHADRSAAAKAAADAREKAKAAADAREKAKAAADAREKAKAAAKAKSEVKPPEDDKSKSSDGDKKAAA
jgi:hypothetical protein